MEKKRQEGYIGSVLPYGGKPDWLDHCLEKSVYCTPEGAKRKVMELLKYYHHEGWESDVRAVFSGGAVRDRGKRAHVELAGMVEEWFEEMDSLEMTTFKVPPESVDAKSRRQFVRVFNQVKEREGMFLFYVSNTSDVMGAEKEK